MSDEVLYVGAVHASVVSNDTDADAVVSGAIPTPIAEIGWARWRTGQAPRGCLCVRLPRWVVVPERAFSSSEMFGKRYRSGTARATPLNTALRAVRDSLEPEVRAGHIPFVLAEFPFSFEYSIGHRLWLDRILGELEGFPLVVGFWSPEWYTSRLIDGLKQRDAALCLYDMPHADGVPPAVEVLTADRVYFKLLGRNSAVWEDHKFAHIFEYRYTDKEFDEILTRLGLWTREVKTVAVVFANGQQAAKSAAMLIDDMQKPTKKNKRTQRDSEVDTLEASP
jgi:uncharacterized protein YecE (DUF72 family)